jgi:trans-aconitate methyltransferase
MALEQRETKPAHWSADRATAFEDQSVVDRYHLRPPYPESIIDILVDLAVDTPRTVLDVGTGTGDLARRLAGRVDGIDALDRSSTMIARARLLEGGDHPRLHWILGSAESTSLNPPYALITGGSSLHWLHWHIAFPRFGSMLSPRGVIAIVHRSVAPTPWRDDLRELLRPYRPERTEENHDLVTELEQRHLFRQIGQREAEPVPFAQSVEDYIGAIHSRSMFSLDRMAPDDAASLDQQVREILRPWSQDGMLQLQIGGSVVWGRVPAAADA